jgi:hypothetical protein
MVEGDTKGITEFSYMRSRKKFLLEGQQTVWDLKPAEKLPELVDESNDLWRPVGKKRDIFFVEHIETDGIEKYFNEIEEINKNKEDEHHIFFFSKGSEILVKNKSNDRLHPVVLNDSIAVKKDIKDQKTHIIWSSEKLGFASVYFIEHSSYEAPKKRTNLVPKNWIVHKLDGQKEGFDYYSWEKIKTPEDLAKIINKTIETK